MKSSPSAWAKSDGMNADSTWSIGLRSFRLKSAHDFTELEINFIAAVRMKLGILVCLLANSLAKVFKLVNAESRTIPAILWSLSACNKAVAAPIDLPHKAIVETVPDYLKYSVTV